MAEGFISPINNENRKTCQLKSPLAVNTTHSVNPLPLLWQSGDNGNTIWHNTGELGYDRPLYDGFLHMTDDMLGPSLMHIKYSLYVYDRFCLWRTNFPGPIESVISKFTCILCQWVGLHIFCTLLGSSWGKSKKRPTKRFYESLSQITIVCTL